MSKVVYALAGVLAALVCALLLLPARAVTLATDRVDDLALHGIRGTLWRGEADVVFRRIDAGRVAWNVDWPALLHAQIGVRWRLHGAGHSLAGRLAQGFDAATLTAAGSVDAAAVNPALGKYDIHIDGTLAVDSLTIRSVDGTPTLAGTLRWSGGPTTYRLAGRIYNADLPPMVASVSSENGEPAVAAHLEEDDTPLITARLRDGWMKIGITKRLTELAGRPWPGNAAPRAIVLTVERELLAWPPSQP